MQLLSTNYRTLAFARRNHPPAPMRISSGTTVRDARDLIIWKRKLRGIEHTQLPPHVGHPNPLAVGDRLIMSIFSPGQVLAVDRGTGRTLWKHSLGERASSHVTFYRGVLLAQTSRRLVCLDPENGHALWEFRPYRKAQQREDIYSSPLCWKGRLYFGDRYGQFYCLDAETGKLLFRKQILDGPRAQINGVAAMAGGVLVVNTIAGAVYGLTLAGDVIWRTAVDGPSISEVRCVGENVAFITNSLYVVRPENGAIAEHRVWPDWEARAFTTTGSTIMVELQEKEGEWRIGATGMPEPPLSRRILLRGGLVMADYTHQLRPVGMRYDSATRLIYEPSMGGLTALSPRTGKAVWKLLPRRGDFGLWTGIPSNCDGALYFLDHDKNLYAVRHP